MTGAPAVPAVPDGAPPPEALPAAETAPPAPVSAPPTGIIDSPAAASTEGVDDDLEQPSTSTVRRMAAAIMGVHSCPRSHRKGRPRPGPCLGSSGPSHTWCPILGRIRRLGASLLGRWAVLRRREWPWCSKRPRQSAESCTCPAWVSEVSPAVRQLGCRRDDQ